MENNYFELAALSVGFIGVFISLYGYLLKLRAERRFETLLRTKMKDVDSPLITQRVKMEIEDLEKTINLYYSSHRETILSEEELAKIKMEIYRMVLTNLAESDKKIIYEDLDQNKVEGQVDYLNKLLLSSGSLSTIKLEK